jgi:hypothetical protein
MVGAEYTDNPLPYSVLRHLPTWPKPCSSAWVQPTHTMASPGFWILLSLPVTLLGQIYLSNWQNRRRWGHQPISHALLRPAGEGLRAKEQVLDEKLSETLLLALAIPWVLAGALFLSKTPPHLGSDLIMLIVVLPFMAFFTRRVLKLGRELRNCRIGFHGERATAEEINQLMLRRCRVFHDVPVPGYSGNIDHVVISRTGVYAVETKTRGKRKVDGEQRHILSYDGQALTFPCGYRDTKPLAQARLQAEKLTTFLSEGTGDMIKVKPIVVLPGWFVEDSSSVNDIPVRNPKGVRHVVLNPRKPIVDQQVLRRVVYQLKRQCRNVTL